jgi:hypothetical protein
MSNRITFFAVWAVCGVGVLLGAQHLRGALVAAAEREGEEPPVVEAPAAAPVARVFSGPNDVALDALARRLERIEQKLDAKLAGGGASAEPPRAEIAQAEAALFKGVNPADRDSAQQQAFDQASAIVDSAIRAGVWIDGDQKSMRLAVEPLAPADRITLRMKLAVAGNEDRLRDLAHEPMFF